MIKKNKGGLMLWPVMVVVVVLVICVLLAPLLNKPNEYGFQARSLEQVNSLEPDQMDKMVVVWKWAHKTVTIRDKAVINYFVSMCKRDLRLVKRERGKNLMHDRIILSDSSGKHSVVRMNVWLSEEQNGPDLVAQNIISRGREFKLFMKELLPQKG